jgi:hypothetical protein
MLTDDDKARIKAEEIYRREVEHELGSGKKKSRIWELLNSSIFLWFLSTIAVGGITYVWTVHQNRIEAERTQAQKKFIEISSRNEMIDKLNIEIEGRLSQFLVDVEHMVNKPYDKTFTLKNPYTLADVRKRWDLMKLPPRVSQTASSVYPDLADRGLVSLVIELDKLSQERDTQDKANAEKPESNEVKIKDRKLRDVVVDVQDDVIFEGKTKNEFLPIHQEFIKRIVRWNNFFPYVDCGPDSPFC